MLLDESLFEDINDQLTEDSLEDSGISKIEVNKLVNSNDKFKVGDHIIKGKDLVDYFDEDEILTISYIPGETPKIIGRKKLTDESLDIKALTKPIITIKDYEYDLLDNMDEDEIEAFNNLGFVFANKGIIPKGTKLKYVGNEGRQLLYQIEGTDYIITFNNLDGMFENEFNDYFQIEESLTEDVDDVVVIDVPDVIADIKEDDITPKGPELGEDTGVANALLDLINGENSTIADYNGFIATVAESHPEFISAIEDIANEENNHVGMLQKLLQQISPNVQTIEQGQLEAEKDLIDDSNDFEVPDFDADDSFDDGFGGIYL